MLIIKTIIFNKKITLIIINNLKNIKNFIIIKKLFLKLNTLFLLLITLTLLKPIQNKKKITNKKSTKKNINNKKKYINKQNTQINSPNNIKKQPKPSSNQLYKYNKIKIHLPNPKIIPPSKHKTTLPKPPPPTITHPNQKTSQNPLILSLPKKSTLITNNISNNTISHNNKKIIFY